VPESPSAPPSEALATTLPGSVRRGVFWRALALQAGWNPQRMQNLGLMTALVPWLRWRQVPLPVVRRICRRHYEYFNTNPYLANFIVGGLIRLEEENLRAGGHRSRQVDNFKASTARAFASLGDQLFWLGLQPSLLLAACLLAMLGAGWVALALIVLFGTAQLWLRWGQLATGYGQGLDIVELLSRPGWHRAIRLSQHVGMTLAGVFAGVYLERLITATPGGPAAARWTLVAGAGCGWLLHKRLPGELVLLLAIPLALAWTYL
jgi:mannose/fructose/N-acetylgalactosamine-specific phosphotransferase system component IID